MSQLVSKRAQLSHTLQRVCTHCRHLAFPEPMPARGLDAFTIPRVFMSTEAVRSRAALITCRRSVSSLVYYRSMYEIQGAESTEGIRSCALRLIKG